MSAEDPEKGETPQGFAEPAEEFCLYLRCELHAPENCNGGEGHGKCLSGFITVATLEGIWGGGVCAKSYLPKSHQGKQVFRVSPALAVT